MVSFCAYAYNQSIGNLIECLSIPLLLQQPSLWKIKLEHVHFSSYLVARENSICIILKELLRCLKFASRMLLLLQWDQSRDFRTTTGSDAGPTCSATRSCTIFTVCKGKIKLPLLASVYYGLRIAHYVLEWRNFLSMFYFSSDVAFISQTNRYVNNDRQAQLTWLTWVATRCFFKMNHGPYISSFVGR